MLNSRRVMIIGISLVVLAAVYKLFIAGGENPQGMRKEDYDLPKAKEAAGDRGGQVGQYRVNEVLKTEYVQRDEQKNIQRVFGFEELLHQTGDNWQLSKPYMRIYQPDAEVVVTADSGSVQVQTVGATPIPHDARLIGNVRFHIVRKVGGQEEVSDIYLDDILFEADKSTFSTNGPVRLVSPQCQMQGRGVEVVYNAGMDRLLLFRVDQLEDMRFQVRTTDSFFRHVKPQGAPAVAGGAGKPDADVTQKPDNQLYELLLNDNVVIEYEDQVVLASRIAIRNILWAPGATGGKSAAGPAGAGPAVAPKDEGPLSEVRLSCDNGVVIKPLGAEVGEFRVRGAQTKKTPRVVTAEMLAEKNVFRARTLDYDMDSGDGLAQGPVEVVFFADTVSDPNASAGRSRASIASSKYASYSAKSNQVRFVGDAVARIVEPAKGWQQKTTVYSDEMVANISTITAGRKAGLSSIEDVNCIGRIVRLETVRKDGEKLLGGVNLKCLNMRYDGGKRVVVATGPGVIAVDNSHMEDKAESADSVNLSKRCYAAVDKFGELRWFVDDGRVLASGADEGLRIAYWPVLDGGAYGSRIVADAHSVQGTFARLPDGRTEVDKLNAFGGVYVERGESQKIWGDSFLYEQNSGLLTVTGRQDKPCVYNGVRASQFEMNVRNGSVKTRISGGGVSR